MVLNKSLCYRALAQPRRALRRPLLHRGDDDRHLLPACLPGAHAAAAERAVLSLRRRGRSGRVSGRAVAAGRRRRRQSRLDRHVRDGVARASADRRRRAGHGAARRFAGRLGLGRAPSPPPLREHLGASPSDIARARRTHFASTLLDETALPITDIAFAAGFRSLRQFNDVIKARYGARPARASAERPRAGGPRGQTMRW